MSICHWSIITSDIWFFREILGRRKKEEPLGETFLVFTEGFIYLSVLFRITSFILRSGTIENKNTEYSMIIFLDIVNPYFQKSMSDYFLIGK